MYRTPKILVAAPQASVKNYCFLDWYLNIKQFSYPDNSIDIFLADNSDTDENAKLIESFGVKVKYIPKKGRGIIEVMAECHQACLDYAKDNDYDYILHLETDIFPKHNILMELMSHNKSVACGLYNIFDGAYREPMIRLIEPKNDGYMRAYGLKNDQANYIDGSLIEVYSGALGCCLIRKDIFDKIKFRSVEGVEQHPDTWFAQDAYEKQIPIYVDTKALCEHRSKSWGTFNLNFK
tara:strand:- start:10011 stop:10718 length:708 start_codon:yes stop_codon:yes gene_type:complete